MLFRGRPIDRPICGIFLIHWHRPIALQIRLINIPVRLQAIRDAASCGKQIAISLALRITLCSIGCLHMTSLLWDSGSCRPQMQIYKPLFPVFFSGNFLTFPLMNNTFSYTMKAPCVFSVWSI